MRVAKEKLHAYKLRAQKSVWVSINISETQGNKDTGATVSNVTRKNCFLSSLYKKMIQLMHSEWECPSNLQNINAIFYCL